MTFLIEIWKRELYICLVQNLFCFSPDKGRDALPSTLNLQFRPDRVGFPFTDRIRFLFLFFLSKLSAHISLGCNSLAIPSTNFPACSLLFLKGRLGLQKMHAKEPKSPASITPIISLTSPLPRLDCNFLSFWTVCQTLWFLQRSKWNI